MASQRMKVSKGMVVVALNDVGRVEYTLSDTASVGLALRVRKSSAAWCLRGRLGERQTTWTIADAREMPDPDAARAAAAEAWKLIRRGIDPSDHLAEIRNGGPVERRFDPRLDGWTWEKARDEYLAHALRDKAAATHRDYRSTLTSPDMRPLEGLLVRQITPQHAKRIQDGIYARGKLPQARHTTHILKACLAWVAGRADSGIEASPIRDVQPLSASRIPQATGHVPTEDELGRLPWRLEAAPITPQSRIAGLLILLTAQRVTTVISARRQDFEPQRDGAEGIWSIPASFMKSGRPHVIPLGRAAWDLVTQVMALGKGPEGWLFPQARPRRAGAPTTGHLSYHPVAEPLHPLDPHDIRRAFATYGQAHLGMKASDTKAILDHAEGNSGDVTAQRYALHDGRHFKWALMRSWEAYVLGLVADRANPPGARLRTLLLPEGPPGDGPLVVAP